MDGDCPIIDDPRDTIELHIPLPEILERPPRALLPSDPVFGSAPRPAPSLGGVRRSASSRRTGTLGLALPEGGLPDEPCGALSRDREACLGGAPVT